MNKKLLIGILKKKSVEMKPVHAGQEKNINVAVAHYKKIAKQTIRIAIPDIVKIKERLFEIF